MSMTIINPATGAPVEVLVRFEGGYVDAVIRADSRAVWEAAAEANGLTIGGVPILGANIDVLGPVELTPATESSPAEYDSRYHVNLRMAERLNWQPLALAWSIQGTPETPNAEEEARRLNRIALIDPDTIKTPARVWL